MSTKLRLPRVRTFRSRVAATLTTMGVLVASTGLVMLVAPAASAHHNTISASKHCNPATGKWDVTWTIKNSESDKSESLSEAHRGPTDPNGLASQINGDTIAKGGSKTYDETVANGAGTLTLSVKGRWTNGVEHVVNPAAAVSVGTDCNQQITKPTHSYTAPDCENAGVLTLPGGDHYRWVVKTDGGASVTHGYDETVTKSVAGSYAFYAQAEPGWEFTGGGTTTHQKTVSVKAKGDGKDCRTVVGPVAPTVDQAVCTGPGQSTTPKVIVAGGPAGVTYSVAGAVVTATIDDSTHKWGTMPAGWTNSSPTEATYTVTFTDPGDCKEGMTPPPAPQPTPPTCTADGSFTLPTDTHKVDWSIAPAYHGVGTYTVTATAKPGYRFNSGNPDSRVFTVEVKAASQDVLCAPVPAEPEVTPPTCAADGSYSLPADTDEVDWSITPTYAGPGDYEVKAATVHGYRFADDSTVQTWDITVEPQVAGLVCYGEVDKPGLAMTPPSCTDPGQLYLQPAGDHVVWTVNGTDTPGDQYFGPGTYDVSAATVGSFKFPDGTTTTDLGSTTVHGKVKGEDCVLGTESSAPKPHKSPTVKGTSAAVPTAVAAGLPGGPGSTSTGSLLAQLMVVGGLVLLLAGGWTGLGRRGRGVHEA